MAEQGGQADPAPTSSGSGSGSGSGKKSSMWDRTKAQAGSMADSTVQGIKEASVSKIVTRIRIVSIVCAVFTLAIGMCSVVLVLCLSSHGMYLVGCACRYLWVHCDSELRGLLDE